MKFKSRKDKLTIITIYGMISIFIGLFILDYINNGIEKGEIWQYVIILGVIGLLISVVHGTNYELSEKYFKYKCGPINGKIEINKIYEIIKDKTMWVGFKPATARKGLIIKYDKYNELYISPNTNELFIEKILELNSEIKIKSD